MDSSQLDKHSHIVDAPHNADIEQVVVALDTSRHGLDQQEADARLHSFGYNQLPQPKPATLAEVFLRQFLSPLIYVLLIAAVVSALIGEYSDAGFIFAVLCINAIIGTYQEYSAEQSADSLRKLVTTKSRVMRDGEAHEIDAIELVPGDVIMLESGSRVPADIRLIDSNHLSVDESLLTGESMSVNKCAGDTLATFTSLADRCNMAYAATMIERGRGRGVVVATGLKTEIGAIAATVMGEKQTPPPLLQRMHEFTLRIALLVGIAAILMAMIAWYQGAPLAEIFILVVALAVSAIPEGLLVALTVALAIGMNRMAKRNVIIRRLVAVEALGSCTYIATDKTGTLTLNELTVDKIAIPGQTAWQVHGQGMIPEGNIVTSNGTPSATEQALLERLCLHASLCNEAFLGRTETGWTHHGDSVDVALLVMAHKCGIVQPEATNSAPLIADIPYEAERRFAATLNQHSDGTRSSVKGALEKILPMCTHMATVEGELELAPDRVETQADQLASEGYRVLAIADGLLDLPEGAVFSEEHLSGLCLLGLVAMIDPLRPEVKAAIGACHSAGIHVCVVTGDHPATALAIAQQLELADHADQVVSGPQLAQADGDLERLCQLTREARVFARVEPQQKQQIVRALQHQGHFVAVTGDGANDAPALQAAQVGIAMGKQGTDVAKETAELVITDDNFASIVAGVEEGRVAYANVRKVIFLLVSTGAAEIVLFSLALFAGLPLPLLAVQLLWLNLVTNGIQDIALAFEPAEGDELKQAPRPPNEPIFNRLMIERTLLSALAIGSLGFLTFQWLIEAGHSVEESRNLLLLLMVLFENVHVFNCRSELRSAFLHSPLRNRLLLFGTLAAQLIHICALFLPGLSDTLATQAVSFDEWLSLLGIALILLFVMELHKWLRRHYPLS